MPPGTCRMCGCTQERACVDSQTMAACSWVAVDLCSACAADPEKRGQARARTAFDLAMRDFAAEHLPSGKTEAPLDLEMVAMFFFSRGLSAGSIVIQEIIDQIDAAHVYPGDLQPALILPGDEGFDPIGW